MKESININTPNYKRKEVAKLFGVHVNTIDLWVKAGKLPALKFGDSNNSIIRFNKEKINEILKNGFK